MAHSNADYTGRFVRLENPPIVFAHAAAHLTMRFSLIDRITRIEPGREIQAIKTVSHSEEILADHFPKFPVLPGVLVLETMTQCGAWLIRATEDFARSMIVLHQAQSIKYAGFVQPGKTLEVRAQITKHDDTFTKLKASGEVDGQVAVTARLTLKRYNLADEDARWAGIDERIIASMREEFAAIYQGDVSGGDSSSVASAAV